MVQVAWQYYSRQRGVMIRFLNSSIDKGYGEMAAIRDVELDAIIAAGKSLAELTLTHYATAKLSRKQAVKKLFGPLMAAWEAGVPFDKMAHDLTTNGIEITPSTLRSYFFDLKTDDQLAAENALHEQKLNRIRGESECKQLAQGMQLRRDLVQAGAVLVTGKHTTEIKAACQTPAPVLDAALSHQTGTGLPPGVCKKALAESGSAPDTIDSSSPSTPNHMAITTHRDIRARRCVIATKMMVESVVVSDALSNVDSGPLQVVTLKAAQRPAIATLAPRERLAVTRGKTLEEIMQASIGQEETPYVEDLELRMGDEVWLASGKQFEGHLSPRTLHMLRTVGRVIAPTIGRTSKDFVVMAPDL